MSKKLNLKILLSVIMLICCLSMLILTGCGNTDEQQNNNQTQNQPTTETITSESAYNTIKTALLLDSETEIDVAKYFDKYELQYDYEECDVYGYQMSESYKQYVDYTNGAYNKYITYNGNTYYYFNGEVTYKLGVYGESTTEIVENNHVIADEIEICDLALSQGVYDNGGYEENAIKTTSENGYSIDLNLNFKGVCYAHWIMEKDYVDDGTFEEYYQSVLESFESRPEDERQSENWYITVNFENDKIASINIIMTNESQPSYGYVGHLLTNGYISLTISKYENEIATPEWVIEYLESQLESAEIA